MLDYRNILQVASDPHKSMRTMELELHSSHHTIRKVLDAAQKAEISWPLPEKFARLICLWPFCPAVASPTPKPVTI